MPGGFQVVLFWDKLHTFLAEYDFTKISPEECFVGCPHAANSHFTNNNWNKVQFIPLGTLSEDVFSLDTVSYFFLEFSLTWIFIKIFQTFKKDFKLFSNLCEPLWRFRIWIFQVFKFSGDLSVLYKLLHKLYVKHQQTIQLQLWCSWNWTSAKFWHSGNLTPLSIPPELNCIGNCKAELSGRSLEMRIWEDIIYRHHCRLAIWKWLVELKMVICHPQILAIVTEQHIVHWLTLTNSCTSYTLLRKWWYQRHCVIGWATPQVPKSLEGKIPKKKYAMSFKTSCCSCQEVVLRKTKFSSHSVNSNCNFSWK